jgi:LPXTG-motif cell wall-anchored protein
MISQLLSPAAVKSAPAPKAANKSFADSKQASLPQTGSAIALAVISGLIALAGAAALTLSAKRD